MKPFCKNLSIDSGNHQLRGTTLVRQAQVQRSTFIFESFHNHMKVKSVIDSPHHSLATAQFNMDQNWGAWALILGLVLCVALFFGGLAPMTEAWETEEYSHAYLIPLISLFLFVQKLPQLAQQTPSRRHWGFALVCAGILFLALGELSSLPTLIQYGFIISLSGFFIAVLGLNGFSVCWTAVAYLCFMIPLPTLIQNNLSHDLQLISSKIGVAIVRLFDISVYLEGNVIDLGQMKLQVVDACSGLRYLFPLMSFGFLIAVLYRAPIWQKVLIFVSTIPITILMNSFRIGLVGVTVEHFGIAAAEGFLHYFEGWFIFVLCLVLLAGLIQLLRSFSKRKGSVLDQLQLQLPDMEQVRNSCRSIGNVGKTYYVSLAIVVVLIPIVFVYGTRQDTLPARETFSTMPLVHQGWLGREGRLDQDVLSTLKLTDYFYADFTRGRLHAPVNLYIAYYASQKKGAGIHSPKSCIPGGGWEIRELIKHQVPNMPQSSQAGDFTINRALIQKGDAKMVVYYWFQQRGRVIHDEYLNRWYVFVDSVTANRSDGALVRVSIPWIDGMEMSDIDRQASEFIGDFYPMLGHYLPN